MRGVVTVVLGTTIIVLAFVAFMASLMWIIIMLQTPADLARVEQLRHDSAQVDPQQAEDVIGQVTETNQKIISTQTFNRQWWAGWVIPDEWQSVELIEVPRE